MNNTTKDYAIALLEQNIKIIEAIGCNICCNYCGLQDLMGWNLCLSVKDEDGKKVYNLAKKAYILYCVEKDIDGHTTSQETAIEGFKFAIEAIKNGKIDEKEDGE